MQDLIKQLKPIEQQILDLFQQKQPLMDKIAALRAQMVNECVHPKSYLVEKSDGTVYCKFCEKRIKVLNDGEK